MLLKYHDVLERISVSKMPLVVTPPEDDRAAFLFLLREGYIEGVERNGRDFAVERVTEIGWDALTPPPQKRKEEKKTDWKKIAALVALAALAVAVLREFAGK